MALAITLAVLATLVAVLALLTAIRTERHVRRLAHALAREWGLRTGSETEDTAREVHRSAATGEQAELRRLVASLEQRVHDLAAQAARLGGGTGPAARGALAHEAGVADPEPRERVRRHLDALGYEDVLVLPGRDGAGRGAFIYEAREDGMPRKGGARVLEDGRVVILPAPALRAFP